MDLADQLKNLFPDHVPKDVPDGRDRDPTYRPQRDPILCKYERRKGKPVTLLEGYHGPDDDLKKLARDLKTHLGVGGSSKNGTIIIQGDYRDKIMDFLKANGFSVKRVGG